MSRRIWIQISIFSIVALTAISIVTFGYMQLPTLLFGVGRYTVTLQLPESGGLYERSNVTYRGTEVGTVTQTRLTPAGVEAELSLRSDISIPADLEAEVHSQSAVGEQYVALLPRSGDPTPLRDGDVIAQDKTSIPPPIDVLLDATNRGLQAIPRDNLQTVVDESFVAVGGLGPDLARILKGGSALARDSRENLDALVNVVDNVGPLLQTQIDTSDSIQQWASHLNTVTESLRASDVELRGVLQRGPAAAGEVQRLFEQLQPTLPILLNNLVSVGQVAIDYQANLEQLLVLLPQGTQVAQAVGVANRGTRQDYRGAYLSFNLNLNVPPPCNTGFLPARQQRSAALEDYPAAPEGQLYCRTPQDSPFNVRGAKNYPCATKPGKRAPTAAMCESDEQYVPLNDGFNWKGDPNATLSGQGVPQFDPGQEVPPGYPHDQPPMSSLPPDAVPPLAIAHYDPSSGTYVTPDGQVRTRSDLAPQPSGRTWQSMLVPPGI